MALIYKITVSYFLNGFMLKELILVDVDVLVVELVDEFDSDELSS